MEQVEHQRCADVGVVEEVRHVEPDEPGIERHFVRGVVEHPPHRPARGPFFEAGADAARVRHAEHRAQRVQRAILAREPHHRGDPFIDHPLFLDRDRATFGADELADPQRQPGPILRLVLQRLQGREAGRLAVLERQVGAAGCQHENLRAAILVDEYLARARLLGLRHQEIDDDCLAAPSRADDQRVAYVALVEAKEIGAARAGLHQRNGVSPMVAGSQAGGIGVEGRERRKIERRDRRRPCPPCEIADELAPIGRFQRRALPRRDHAGIGKRRARDRHVVAQPLEAVRIHREREVMIAQDEAVGHEVVRRVDEIEHLADRPIVGVLHLLLPQPEPLRRRSAAEEGEGLRQHEREIDREQ